MLAADNSNNIADLRVEVLQWQHAQQLSRAGVGS
jgi:hypothetical protein